MPYGETCLLWEDLWEDGESGVCPLRPGQMCTTFIGKRLVVSFTRFSLPLSFLTHPDTEV